MPTTTKISPAGQIVINTVAAGTAQLFRTGRSTDGTGFADFFLRVDTGTYRDTMYQNRGTMKALIARQLIQEGERDSVVGLSNYMDRAGAPRRWHLTPAGKALVTTA